MAVRNVFSFENRQRAATKQPERSQKIEVNFNSGWIVVDRSLFSISNLKKSFFEGFFASHHFDWQIHFREHRIFTLSGEGFRNRRSFFVRTE